MIQPKEEYFFDKWVHRNNRKKLISRVICWNELLAVARRINRQDDYTKYMLSIIAIVMWLFSKVPTYPELGQIQNWQKNCRRLKWLEQMLMATTNSNYEQFSACNQIMNPLQLFDLVTGRFVHFPVSPESFRPESFSPPPRPPVVPPSIMWVISPSYPEWFRPLLDEWFRPLSKLIFYWG